MAGIQGALEANSSLLGGPLCAGVAGSATEPPVERVPALVTPEGLWCSSPVSTTRSKGFFFPKKDEVGLVLHEQVCGVLSLLFLAHFIWG